MTASSLLSLSEEIVGCEACPRLVAWRTSVAREKRAAFAAEEYWGRPVPGFGDPGARMLVLGLAPAAHGGNRTGRVFTGDRSGDWLFGAMHRAGFANRPTSLHAGDGLELHDAYVAAAVRCAPPANRPTPEERDRCAPFLDREVQLLERLRLVVALGAFAYEAAWRLADSVGTRHSGARPRFTHGLEVPIGRSTILCSYHPSQQNTFTGRLTAAMLDAVFSRARMLVES